MTPARLHLPPAELSAAQRAREQLQIAFGNPFTLWTKHNHVWVRCAVQNNDTLVTPARELAQWFEQLAAGQHVEPQLITLPSGDTYAAHVSVSHGRPPLIVAGRVELNPLRLATKLACGAVAHSSLLQECRTQQDSLDQYESRLIEGYEAIRCPPTDGYDTPIGSSFAAVGFAR